MQSSVLLLASSRQDSSRWERILRPLACRIILAHDVPDVLGLLAEERPRAIITDWGPESKMGEALAKLRNAAGETRIVRITGTEGSPPGNESWIRPGEEGLDLVSALRDVLQPSRIESLEDEVEPGTRLIGRSESLRRIVETLEQVAPTGATILLQGESGTGKEVLARLVHEISGRGPFLAINCAAMPEGLVESTLFGHEKGAFTGAASRVPGAFERADGGTLLLDEISEMDLALQGKLLRAVQELQFERVGGSESIRVDTRLVATTNLDLAQAVDEGRFREDLFYRLSIIPIQVPPLRERREDIIPLAQHFLDRAATLMRRPARALSPRAAEMLLGHTWPGNVRELCHVVERAVALSTGEVLEADDFVPEKRGIVPWRRREEKKPVVAELDTYSLKSAERVLIDRALEATGGNRTRAADLLEISPRTLRNKLNRPGEGGEFRA